MIFKLAFFGGMLTHKLMSIFLANVHFQQWTLILLGGQIALATLLTVYPTAGQATCKKGFY